MRIPLLPNLEIDTAGGGGISVLRSGTTNAIFNKYADGAYYASQRPAINITDDASGVVTDVNGRACYYWNAVSATYHVNYDTVYKSGYSGTALATLLTAGTEKCYFFEVGDYLVLIDPQGNKGYYISSGASTTMTEITDVSFPPKQTPALTLCNGGAVLNGHLYVGCTNGELWNCDSEDPINWTSLSFRSAESKPDPMVHVFEHNSHVVTAGTRTLEFFYDNANATGSPLNPRVDITPQVGTIDAHTVWNDGEQVYFCSLNVSGDLNVLMMQGFQISKISTPDLDTFLTQSVINDGIEIMASGFSAGGKSFYILTLFNTAIGSSGVNEVIPTVTIVYDASAGHWGNWECMIAGINYFPLIDWTQSTSTRAGNGIMSNGDILTVIDNSIPQDLVEASAYVLSGYVSPGYILSSDADGANIQMELVTGPIDGNTRGYKNAANLRLVHTPTPSSQTITVYHSDQGNNNYGTGRTLDTSSSKEKLTRLGRFNTRNHKLVYAGSVKLEIEALELDVY